MTEIKKLIRESMHYFTISMLIFAYSFDSQRCYGIAAGMMLGCCVSGFIQIFIKLRYDD